MVNDETTTPEVEIEPTEEVDTPTDAPTEEEVTEEAPIDPVA